MSAFLWRLGFLTLFIQKVAKWRPNIALPWKKDGDPHFWSYFLVVQNLMNKHTKFQNKFSLQLLYRLCHPNWEVVE